MPSEQYVTDRILAALPGADVVVLDTTGTGDHFAATVTAEQFAGRSRVEQHKLVYVALEGDMGDHAIHALQLSTRAAPPST